MTADRAGRNSNGPAERRTSVPEASGTEADSPEGSAPDAGVAIVARGLRKSFGLRAAVRDVSFTAAAGTITALLGANGAGKSTTLRMLTGALTPDAGSARIDGHDVTADAEAARARTGYLPEAATGFQHLTPGELLLFAAEARGLNGPHAIDETRRVTALLDLAPVIGQTLGTLSKGWRQRAWLAQALIGDPPVLILDEPTDGLDPTQKIALRRLLRELAEDKAILMSTHILEEAEELCDRVIVMADGRIVADATTRDLVDGAGRLAAAFTRLTQTAAAAS